MEDDLMLVESLSQAEWGRSEGDEIDGNVIKDEFVPNYPQSIFYSSEAPNQLFKGGVRSGKTTIAIKKIIKVMANCPGIKVLITRTTNPALMSTTYPDFMKICPVQLIHEALKTPYVSVEFKNGSKAYFIALEEHDIEKIKSHEFGVIWLEEASLFSERAFYFFQDRLSQTKGLAFDVHGRRYMNKIERTYCLLTTNSSGRNWIWKIFMKDNPHNSKSDFFWVNCTTFDNRVNLSQEYFDRLSKLPKHIFERQVMGDDSPYEGLVFPMFDRDVHVLDKRFNNWCPPGHWNIYMGLDYGYQTNTAVVWIAVDEQGYAIVFKEYVAKGKSVKQNAEAILSITGQLMQRGMAMPRMVICDPAIAQKKGENELGFSIYDQLVTNGLNNIVLGSRDLKSRIVQMSELLSMHKSNQLHPLFGTERVKNGIETGWPKVFFTADCTNTIDEYEEWEWKRQKSVEKEPDEKPEERNDHCIDSSSYALCSGMIPSLENPVAIEIKQNSLETRLARHRRSMYDNKKTMEGIV